MSQAESAVSVINQIQEDSKSNFYQFPELVIDDKEHRFAYPKSGPYSALFGRILAYLILEDKSMLDQARADLKSDNTEQIFHDLANEYASRYLFDKSFQDGTLLQVAKFERKHPEPWLKEAYLYAAANRPQAEAFSGIPEGYQAPAKPVIKRKKPGKAHTKNKKRKR